MTNKQLHAVIQLGSKQYLVKVGDKIVSEKIELKEGEKLNVKDVLLTHDGEKTQVGAPFVEGASVDLDFEGTDKGVKIRVAKFKAKSRYRRVMGHRQFESHFTVKAINI
ncbi:MAG: 50S ribosomal protein L21 [Candidatus Collierbacteria bacterium GW2011_GWC1_45_47]|uniref:Large ribosomal subunit protein bL21 n=6 Tax=Candidatus Collieribacteriota TaxID=1752725 RepID=A0A0G1HJJ3_9BACT|nr:MAG: 50S ribosomal protein L21 [Candidatus Collierbacteria bacterium GW2011_GWA1_44_12]KKT37591.1 MAG: 50S ribosomal protein L21 [Candidatus Collierbacteria bacterium GW2011_GWF1_44_12]KKT46728.1 MAG: 50S ribosomal protein L21 [Candidatus Collierbacteria bacterium GW2011_GWF2_44_15]KKT67820.1 MAG: 50S ribosomal protein L21 [Candidatus Collierbacteria bacterium GW2011_GWB1_44_35]KKT98879.1 MAG: 50S ribosomal protein L21 [Candidatus Collierbacteria bacterium GW2011_GWC2_45_15]KKU09001.1 MAG: 